MKDMGSIDKDYLMHHGVKGMKWGVRRYQNPDGSLTDAGRRKYLTESGGLTKAGYKAVKKGVKESERLKRRANLFEQQADAEKYGRRANIAGAVALGAVAAGPAAKAITEGVYDRSFRKNQLDLDRVYSRMFRTRPESSTYQQLHWQAHDLMGKGSKIRERNMAMTRADRNIGAVSKYVAAGAAGVAAYSKIRQKIAEKNIRDIQSGEAATRYKEHTQKLITAFGNKTVNDVRNFDKKKFGRDLEKLGAAENKVANLESHKNRVYKGDPKNGSYFYDKPIAEAKAARDAQYNKMASNTVARGKLEGKYGYKDGVNTYYKDKKRKK